MNKEKIEVNIHTFQAFDGDSFLVTIFEPKSEINILVDCGNKETYQSFIKPYLCQMSQRGKIIDYLILTHIHSDHIGGAVPLLLENGSSEKAQIIEIGHVIYNGYLGLNLKNYSKEKCPTKERRIYQGIMSEGQAILNKGKKEKQITLNEELCISKLLIKGDYKWNRDGIKPVLADLQEKLNIGEYSYIQFISPNKQQLIRMNEKWEAYLKRIYRKMSVADNNQMRNAYEAYQWIINNIEYDTLQGFVSYKELDRATIEEMATKNYSYDYTEENNSSIAFILVVADKKILFLGDANIEICRDNLEKIYGTTPMKMECIKLSHHGSKRNVSLRFLNQFGSDSYLISSGTTNIRPSMETIAKLLVNRPSEHKKIYITNRNHNVERFDVESVHNTFSFEFINTSNKLIEI